MNDQFVLLPTQEGGVLRKSVDFLSIRERKFITALGNCNINASHECKQQALLLAQKLLFKESNVKSV